MKQEPVKIDEATMLANRKKARRTALILGAVALGFFAWSIYIVTKHASL